MADDQLRRASLSGKLTEVHRLLKDGANVNSKKDGTGWTPLHYAVCSNDIDTVQFLLSNGAKVNARHQFGSTPLHTAVEFEEGNLDILRSMIKSKARLNLKDNDGLTALNLAICCNNIDAACILLENGADPFIKDDKDKLPIDYAKDPDVKEMILEWMEKFKQNPPSLEEAEHEDDADKPTGEEKPVEKTAQKIVVVGKSEVNGEDDERSGPSEFSVLYRQQKADAASIMGKLDEIQQSQSDIQQTQKQQIEALQKRLEKLERAGAMHSNSMHTHSEHSTTDYSESLTSPEDILPLLEQVKEAFQSEAAGQLTEEKAERNASKINELIYHLRSYAGPTGKDKRRKSKWGRFGLKSPSNH